MSPTVFEEQQRSQSLPGGARRRRLLSLALLSLAAAAPARAAFAAAPDEEKAAPAPAAPSAPAADAPPPPAPPEPPAKKVVYLPETVKQEVIEQIRKEVMEQAKAEGWAWSNLVPVWIQRLRFSGDVRARFERILFPRGNVTCAPGTTGVLTDCTSGYADGGEFPDFNAINNGNPFDVNFVDYANERYLNVSQNRTRPRLRARLGTEADIGNGFTIAIRAGSGDSATPVSTNQTLGATGDFSKLPLWLDRASVTWDAFADENLANQAQNLIERRHLVLQAGRFENPFFTTELLFAKDVNFDGVAFKGDLLLDDPYARVFLAGGAFPLQITSLNFPAERPDKFPSRNKWLYGGQAGLESHVMMFKFRAALGFFAFTGVEGRLSSPCDTNLKGISCDTDNSRPGFAQQGNTYLALRTPSDAALALEGASTVSRYQYFGLASRFREVTASLRTEVKVDTDVKLTIEGEYSHNAGFNHDQIAGVALNNRAALQTGDVTGAYAGGADAGLGRITIGSPSQNRQWDWRFGVSYRYVESDSVLDALNDSDFGLGGTNLKGYTLEAALSVALDVTLSAKWFSASAVVGPKYSADVLQLDLQTRF